MKPGCGPGGGIELLRRHYTSGKPFASVRRKLDIVLVRPGQRSVQRWATPTGLREQPGLVDPSQLGEPEDFVKYPIAFYAGIDHDHRHKAHQNLHRALPHLAP